MSLEPKEVADVSIQSQSQDEARIQTQTQNKSNESQIEVDDNESACAFESKSGISSLVDGHEFDIGKWIGQSGLISSCKEHEILKRCWKPPENYNFLEDAIDQKRTFLYEWLEVYKPWLSYSSQLKGAFCLDCVMFSPTTVRGVLGAFIASPFTRYQKMHESCESHTASQ